MLNFPSPHCTHHQSDSHTHCVLRNTSHPHRMIYCPSSLKYQLDLARHIHLSSRLSRHPAWVRASPGTVHALPGTIRLTRHCPHLARHCPRLARHCPLSFHHFEKPRLTRIWLHIDYPEWLGNPVPGTPGTRDTRYPGHPVPGTPGTRDTRYPGHPVPGTSGTRDTRYPGHPVPGTPGTRNALELAHTSM